MPEPEVLLLSLTWEGCVTLVSALQLYAETMELADDRGEAFRADQLVDEIVAHLNALIADEKLGR